MWADRHPRHRRALVVGGLLGMAASLLGVALAPSPPLFAVAMGCLFVTNGLGVNLSQATLMDATPDEQPLWMTRWVTAGTLGDLAGPLCLSAAAWAAVGWRGAMAAIAALVATHALWLARQPFPEPSDGDDGEATWTDAVRTALRDRILLSWVGGVALCGLLDETFVALASAWLARAFDASLAVRGAVVGGATLGGVLGLVVLERLLARGTPGRTLLLLASCATGIGLAAWLAAPTLATSALLLFALEAVAAPLYPLAQAEAFRALPDRAALVEALQSVLAPVDWLLPVALGLLADRWGLGWALGALAAQPIGLALLAWLAPVAEAQPEAHPR
jgi:MFS family permease